MATLFGIDIAGLVASGFASAGGLAPGILIKNDNSRYTFDGILTVQERRRPNTAIAKSVPTLLILGASVTNRTVPVVNDTVEIENKTFQLIELLSRDPADASYTFVIEELVL